MGPARSSRRLAIGHVTVAVMALTGDGSCVGRGRGARGRGTGARGTTPGIAGLPGPGNLAGLRKRITSDAASRITTRVRARRGAAVPARARRGTTTASRGRRARARRGATTSRGHRARGVLRVPGRRAHTPPRRILGSESVGPMIDTVTVREWGWQGLPASPVSARACIGEGDGHML